MAVLAALSCLGFAPLVRISPAHPAHGAPFDPLTPVLTSSSITGRAHNLVMMGRAEKRMAKKRAAKGPQYQGGRPLKPSAKGDDRLPRKTVLTRLREAPVFGIRVLEGSDALRNEQGFLVQDGCDGLSTFYMNPREAERAVASQGSGRGLRVTGLTLDAIFFDPSVQLKPDQSAMQAVGTIPSSRALTSPVTTPLYCIDGMQMTATESGVSSLPLFFSKDDVRGWNRTPIECSIKCNRVQSNAHVIVLC